MDMLVIIDEDIHATALATARQADRRPATAGGKLHAALDDEEEDWFSRIWDATEAAILEARDKGKSAAREFIRQATELATAAAKALGERYRSVRARIARRLDAYVQTLVDAALARMRPILSVGDRELPVARIAVSQKLLLSGSAKASLEEVCAFVAEGELSVSVEYGRG